MMVSSGVTKYNLGTHIWHPPAQAAGRQLVLVTGQVESDASLRLGAPGISTNIALLKAAREMHPLAWLLYKPHPDVVAGLRGEGFMESSASQWCDEVVTDVAMGQLLKTVEVVHVMTSLSGFEALIRGKRVVCHGSPFYSGWGLTSDLLETPRRSRSLNLDQLVAGALLEYPRYLNRRTGQPGSAEDVLADMLEWKANAPLHLPWWRRAIRPILRRP
jgi:capsular polysaccharide export protein